MDDEPPGGEPRPDAVARLLRARVVAGELWLAVDGRSMWPTIRPPATVLLVASSSPRRGEVWAFVAGDEAIVVHRCERRAGTGHVFRGDAMAGADPWVPVERLVGRVATVVDVRGRRSLGPADRARGMGRSAVQRGRKWVGRLMVRLGRRR